jgi:hypothetical protein
LRLKIEKFCEYKRKHFRSEATIRTYLIVINKLLKWGLSQNISDIFLLSQLQIEQYVHSEQISFHELNQLRVFFEWAKENRFIITNPIYKRKWPKPQVTTKRKRADITNKSQMVFRFAKKVYQKLASSLFKNN